MSDFNERLENMRRQMDQKQAAKLERDAQGRRQAELEARRAREVQALRPSWPKQFHDKMGTRDLLEQFKRHIVPGSDDPRYLEETIQGHIGWDMDAEETRMIERTYRGRFDGYYLKTNVGAGKGWSSENSILSVAFRTSLDALSIKFAPISGDLEYGLRASLVKISPEDRYVSVVKNGFNVEDFQLVLNNSEAIRSVRERTEKVLEAIVERFLY